MDETNILTLTLIPFDGSGLDFDDVIKKLSLAFLWSVNNLSKLLLRPGTARRKDIICDRQVSDRVHGLFVSADTTPQCLSESYSRSLIGKQRCDVEFRFPCVDDVDDDDDELDEDELDEFDDELDDAIVTDVVSMLAKMHESLMDFTLAASYSLPAKLVLCDDVSDCDGGHVVPMLNIASDRFVEGDGGLLPFLLCFDLFLE